MEPHRRPVWARSGETLVFGFNNGLYSVKVDGTGLRKLFVDIQTEARGSDWWNFDNSPSAQATGDELAFVTLRHNRQIGEPHIYDPDTGTWPTPQPGHVFPRHHYDPERQSEIILATIDGSTYRRLTHDTWDEYNPALSPDGSTVAFISGRDFEAPSGTPLSTSPGIYVVSVETPEQPRRIVPLHIFVPSEQELQWSFDSKTIAFIGEVWGNDLNDFYSDNLKQDRDVPDSLLTVDVSSGKVSYISAETYDYYYYALRAFAWSPVENRIAGFEAELQEYATQEHGTHERWVSPIYTWRPDGSDQQVFDGPRPVQFTRVLSMWWAPGGDEIRVFGSRHDGLTEFDQEIITHGLFAIYNDGREPRLMVEMTEVEVLYEWPRRRSWSPGGSLIAFTPNSNPGLAFGLTFGYEGDVLWITDSNLENKRVLVTSRENGTTCGMRDYKLIGADGKEAIE